MLKYLAIIQSKTASNKDVISWAAENVKPKHVTTRDVLGSLFLMTVPPLFVHILTFALRDERINGSLYKLLDFVMKQGPVPSVKAFFPSIEEIQEGSYYVVMFGFIQFLLMWIVPGHEHKGPIAPSGHVPVYKANGVQCFLLTIVLWAVGAYLQLFPAGWQYTYAPGMFAFLNISALLLCVGLYFKGRFAPSTADAGHSGNFIFDMFWGTELYPRFGHSVWPIGWDVKLWTNCRFGMMYWGLSGMPVMVGLVCLCFRSLLTVF